MEEGHSYSGSYLAHLETCSLQNSYLQGSIFLASAVAVVCGLGKSRRFQGIEVEQFELSLPLFDGLKTRRNPESTK